MTDADGNIAQHIEYIPYGEVFVEERNSQFSTNFLFDTKGNPKLHPKTKAPLMDDQSGVVDRTASVFDFIIDLGSTVNSVIQY